MIDLRNWTAERAWLALSVVFGLFFVVATPPFQSPDEVNHFLRIYQLSEGRIIGEKQGQTSGGELPTAVSIETHHFDRLPFDRAARTSASEILNHLLYGPRFGTDTDRPRGFGAFPNTVRYSPAPYLPHIAAVLLARGSGLTVLAGAYLCRLAALLTAILLIRASLRALPEAMQWSFAALALLPMGIFITAMASPDGVMIAASFAVFALAVWLSRTADAPMSPRIWTAYGALLLFFALAKVGYFLVPAAMAIGLFPRMKSAWRRAGLLSGTIALAVLLTAAWLITIAPIRTPPRVDTGIDPTTQLALVLDDPGVFVNAFVFDVSRRWPHYYDSFVGKLGWLDVELPRWSLTALTLLFLLFAVTRCRSEVASPFTWWQSALLAAIPVLTLVLTAFLQYLDWVTVGAGDLRNVLQGRHYYPVVPALLIAAPRRPLPDAWARYRPVVFVVGYGVCLTATAITLLQRYYG